MDLSGRSSAYRGTVARCPACGEAMRTELTKTAQVDACDACGGLWVDWFDGELHDIAAEAEAARVERGTPLPPPSLDPEARSKPCDCPRCTKRLGAELYRFRDARDDELVTGVELLRCSECAGAFVPRGSAHLLLDRVREARPASVWEALLALLRSLFTGR